MFEFSIVWIITIIVSCGLNLSNCFIIFKDAADLGYKINIDKLNVITNEIDLFHKNLSLLKILIPFYNLVEQLKIRMQYMQHRNNYLKQLNIMGTLEKMSECEKIEYDKKPTGLNAIIVSTNLNIELNDASKITLKDNQGTIWFKTEKDIEEIVILKSDGLVKNLSLEEQKRMVKEYFIELTDSIIQQYEEMENLKKDVEQHTQNTAEINISSSPSKQIEDLKKLRYEYTENPSLQSYRKNKYQKTNKKDK